MNLAPPPFRLSLDFKLDTTERAQVTTYSALADSLFSLGNRPRDAALEPGAVVAAPAQLGAFSSGGGGTVRSHRRVSVGSAALGLIHEVRAPGAHGAAGDFRCLDQGRVPGMGAAL